MLLGKIRVVLNLYILSKNALFSALFSLGTLLFIMNMHEHLSIITADPGYEPIYGTIYEGQFIVIYEDEQEFVPDLECPNPAEETIH